MNGDINLKEFSVDRIVEEVVIDGEAIPFTANGKSYGFKKTKIKNTLIMR